LSISSSVIAKLAQRKSSISNWTVSFLLFAGALGLRLLLADWLEPNKFLTFYPAVAAAALLGWREGSVVAFLSAVAAWFFFFEPRYSFAVADKNLLPLVVGFLFVSGFLIWIVQLLRATVVELQLEVAARREAEAALRAVDRRKDEFLATLGHELRNPLTPIHNVTHILKTRTGPEDPNAPLLDMIDRQLKHLVRLVDDLLEISRINLGKIELQKQRVDISALLRDVTETCQPFIEKKEHRVSCNLPSEPLWVFADPVRLTQVATNLLSNAIKYTPPRGVIHLSTARDGDAAVLRVRDNGIGIQANMLTHVFDLFTQVNGEARLSEGGIGVGLALSRKLVALHGGRIEAHSDGLGCGSEFVVHLPFSPDTPETSSKSAGFPQKLTPTRSGDRDEKDIAQFSFFHDVPPRRA
jgi:signal transduction histidine kinase